MAIVPVVIQKDEKLPHLEYPNDPVPEVRGTALKINENKNRVDAMRSGPALSVGGVDLESKDRGFAR